MHTQSKIAAAIGSRLAAAADASCTATEQGSTATNPSDDDV